MIEHMKAPPGRTSAVIEGHTYEIPKNGVVKLVSQNHVPTLERHGFVPHYEEPVNVAEQIEAMEDKAELVTFIEERGGEADDSMSLKKLKRLAREAAGVEE